MKRRIAILFGTFAVLLLAFLLYYQANKVDVPTPWRSDQPTKPDAGGSTTIPAIGGSISPVSNPHWYQYDENHRLQAKYTAAYSEKVGSKLYMKEPRVEWFLSGGQVVVIRARRAVVTPEDMGDSWKISRGELTGDVQILIDRGQDPDRPSAPNEVIKIFVDEGRFDNDLLTIQSDGPVSVYSREADIFGKGLSVSWDEGPRQLRELRIEQGDRMIVREGQARFVDQISLPGGVQADSGASATGQLSQTAAPGAESSVPSKAANDGAGSVPAKGPATELTASTAPATGASTAVTATSTAPASPAPYVSDTYVATFEKDVNVTSGQRYLKGADELRLTFEFKGTPYRRRADQPGQPAAETLATGQAQPAEPSEAPSAARSAVTSAATSAAASAAGEPAGSTGRDEPMIITWTGPLVVKPLRGHGKPIPKRFDVAVKGKTLEMSDGSAKALCERFEFSSTAKSGELAGSDERPVRLSLSNGEEVFAVRITFDRRIGRADMFGAGSMLLPVPDTGSFATPRTTLRSSTSLRSTRSTSGPVAAAEGNGGGVENQTGARKGTLTIDWTERVVALLGRRSVQTDSGSGSEEFLRTATFFGNVDVRQGRTRRMRSDEMTVNFRPPAGADDRANRMSSLHAAGNVRLDDLEKGDFVESQVLDVEMSPATETQLYPRQVTARGDVSARQGASEVEADELTIDFAQVKDEKTGELKIGPQRLEAKGSVKITDRSGSHPSVVEGEVVTSDLSSGTAGVAGPGRMRFFSDTDISGNKAGEPRPVDVAWTTRMDYSGKERTAIIEGDVRFQTAGDRLDCDRMLVIFAPAGEANAQGAPESLQPSRMADPRRFRSRKIETVVAKNRVRLESVKKDEEGFLLQRVQLRGDHLTYQAGKGGAKDNGGSLYCKGPGTLTAEDYRAPGQPGRDRPGDILAGNVSRPSQTAFRWSDSMRMDQSSGTVRMAGKVWMVHRSGREIALIDKLKIRPWGQLPKGRNTELTCDEMEARFARAENAAPVDGQGRAGPQVGPLEQFDATGETVNLRDGDEKVVCQRIFYRRSTDKAIIWGSLPGRPARNAVIYQRGSANVLRSPKFVWHRKNNRFEAKGVRVRGGL